LDALDTRKRKSWIVGPVSEGGRITANADPLPERGCGAIEDEHLVPTWWANMGIWWSGDLAAVSGACHGWEEGALAEIVSVSRGDTSQ